MSRLTSVAVAVLLSAAVAYGRGEIVSYSKDIQGTGVIVASADNPDGFVLTDVLLAVSDNNVEFYQGTVHPDGRKLYLEQTWAKEYHFESGIAFDPGSVVTVKVQSSGFAVVTISGYVPCPSPCWQPSIPAVGNVGLGILIATIAAAGGWVLSRRKGFERAA